MLHPEFRWIVACLCRGSDPDRAPRFEKALRSLGAEGVIGNLDDGPGQKPISPRDVESSVSALLPSGTVFERVLTHGPWGEYTRHRRHEEISAAVQALWRSGRLQSSNLVLFAYSDRGGSVLPRAVEDAHFLCKMPNDIYRRKMRIISEIYGFGEGSFESRSAANVEGFWEFGSVDQLKAWIAERGAAS